MTDMKDLPDAVEIVRMVTKYLLVNPLACDTADGIGRWWLASAPIPMERLLATLTWMKELGLIEELVAADGRLRYRRIASEARLVAAIESFGDSEGTRH